MRKHLLAGAASLAIGVALSGPLAAADYPTKAGPMAAPAVFSWSGFYFGGHLGYGQSRFNDISDGDRSKGGGFIGGIHYGTNWQTGNIVFGLESDVTWGGAIKNRTATDQLHTNVLTTTRARLGLAMDRVLVYATGGWGTVIGKMVSSEPHWAHFTKSRPVVGGGIEWAATNNVFYRIEALDFIGTNTVKDGGGDFYRMKDIWEIRVGLTYRFDASFFGKGPVVAKY